MKEKHASRISELEVPVIRKAKKDTFLHSFTPPKNGL